MLVAVNKASDSTGFGWPLYTLCNSGCRCAQIKMNCPDLIKEIVNTYQKHGWRLRRILLRPEARAELNAEAGGDSFLLDGVQLEEAAVDGLWFSRASAAQREAWELRLLAENPFALFETFEADETEEEREEVRREMEARLRDYVCKE
jgi:hypothetical protein